mgnify:CR=1 FL=1
MPGILNTPFSVVFLEKRDRKLSKTMNAQPLMYMIEREPTEHKENNEDNEESKEAYRLKHM